MSKEKRCGSTGGWGRCYQLTLHTNKNQPAPSKNWCLIPKGLLFWHPNSHPFKARLGGSKNGKFLLCFFFFQIPKNGKTPEDESGKKQKIIRCDLEFKRLARKDTRSSREQHKNTSLPCVWHFWVDDFPNLTVWWDMLTDYWDPPQK